jgi:hypothetical protein
MELTPDEMNMLDEISVKPPERKTVTFKPKPKIIHQQPEAPPDINAFVNTSKMHEHFDEPPPQYQGEEEYEDEGGGYQDSGMPQQPSEGYKTIEDEKADLLNKLARLQKKGFSPNKKFGAHCDIEELRTEYKRITYGIEAEQSIKFQRRIMVACVTGLEFMNKRYDPFDLHLDGWSESMMENIDDYDGVFEELYGKYREKVAVAPEIKLVMMVGGSAMMFHLTNSMFKAAIPNMSDVLKQNPDLVKNMVDAVKNSQAPPPGTDGRREMKGPGIDITSILGGGFPPMPQMVRQPAAKAPSTVGDDLSDIVSIQGSDADTRDVNISGSSRKRRKAKKEQNEINL